jgi:hypothetical protein
LKLYLLKLPNLISIYNYINKTDKVINEDIFFLNTNLGDKVILNKSQKPFETLICLGSFLNIPIFSYTQMKEEKIGFGISPQISQIKNNIKLEAKLSKIKVKKLIKLIKCLCQCFPQYSYEFFLYHIISKKGFTSNNTQYPIPLSIEELNKIKLELVKKGIMHNHSLPNLNSASGPIVYKNSIDKSSSSKKGRIQPINYTINNNYNSSNLKRKVTDRQQLSLTEYNIPKYYFSKNEKCDGKSEKSEYCEGKSQKLIINNQNPQKLQKDGNLISSKNVYLVTRNTKIKTDCNFSDEESDIISISSNSNISKRSKVSNVLSVKNEKNITYNTPTKKKVLKYYS